MIPLRFYRDKSHVYVNNPDGITKQMSIADFEAMLNGGGGGGDSAGIFVVNKLYNAETHVYYLDKTFAEICGAISAGKLVVTFSVFEKDGTFYVATTGIIDNAYFDEETENNIVEIFSSNYHVVFVDRYIEVDGVLAFDSKAQIPPPLYEVLVFMANTLYTSGPSLLNSLSTHYCFFVDGGAGTNNRKNYLAKEFGKTGSTYYVVLSNGDRYEGGETGNMTKVTVTP